MKNTINVNDNNIDEPVIKETKKPVKKTSKKVPTSGVVGNCDKLNVRNNPSANASIVDVIDNGTLVEINGNDGDFYKVRVNGVDGYCMKQFITC